MNKQALVVGINNYAISPTLKYATHDASEVGSALQMPEYGFDTISLLDDKATVGNLKTSLTALLKSDAAIKLFFFAGHGYANDTGVYLVTSDDSDNPELSLDWVRSQVLAAKGTVILILDCCHSGAAAVRSNTAAYRWLTEGDIDRSIGSLGSGKILLAACASHETAVETEEAAHGVFTFHLLEGLMGQASNLRGIISPLGLFDYVADKFNQDGIQTPVFKGEQAGSIALGAGFTPPMPFSLNPLTPMETQTPPNLIVEFENQASQHMNSYLEQTAIPYEKWKTDGFKKASQLLEPTLRWFRRTVSENPELLSSSIFSDAYSEARARLTQLGALSEGTHTEEGRVEKRLGSGAFGTVWRVQCPNDRILAYKIYHATEIDLKDKVARFERGYRAMQQLEHPHIVKVHKYTQCPVGFYMDLVDGPNLRDFSGTIAEPIQMLELLIKIAETLQHAHGRNVIHRDVKPENIVLQYETETDVWVPYLTDFDLAWFSAATQLTKDAFGAIFYAAPEQLTKPSSHVAHAPTTDIYSFGQLCFFVATGSDPIPFGGADNVSGLRGRIGNWGVERAANIFADLYEQCTKQDPKDRLQNFRAISDRLFEAYGLIREADPDQAFQEDRFTRELVYALAGLSDSHSVVHESFGSLSGRTFITIEDVSERNELFDLTIHLEQGALSISGATAESARRMLNGKLDRAMAGYGNVTRRPGSRGTYEVFLDIRQVENRLSGVEQCRRIIARAVDTMESR